LQHSQYTKPSLSMRIKTPVLLFDARTLFIVYGLVAIGVSIQSVLLPPHLCNGAWYQDYNNFIIFRRSSAHLLAGSNLYSWYLAEHWDQFKYSPTFALAMGLIAWLPTLAGLVLWNLANALPLAWAIIQLPLRPRARCTMLWFILPELITSLQNAQSNGLMAALMIAAFAQLHKGGHRWAALWAVMAVFIKVYGGIVLCMFFFYPGKWRSFTWLLFWALIMVVVPCMVTSLDTLQWQYGNWAHMIAEDQRVSYGVSVAGWLHSWFRLSGITTAVSMAGIILFTLPLARWRLWGSEAYRRSMLAFMLVWVVIFNHKAESPTYVIAIAGVALWYYSHTAHSWRTAMMLVIFIFTILAPTDLYPPIIRDAFFVPYSIKAIPCITLWCILLAELMVMRPTGHENAQPSTTNQWAIIKKRTKFYRY